MIYSQLISLIFLYIQKGVRSKRNKDRINSKISIEGDLTPLVSDDDKGYDFLDPLNDEDIYESSLNQDDIWGPVPNETIDSDEQGSVDLSSVHKKELSLNDIFKKPKNENLFHSKKERKQPPYTLCHQKISIE